MLTVLQALTTIVGRICLCAVFLQSVFASKIPNFSSTVNNMRFEGIPYPKAVLSGTIVVLILGSSLVMLGFKARFGAFLLMVFLVLTTYYFSDFWRFSFDPQTKLNQFMKNLGLIGAMLMIIANGPGAGSLDRSK